MLEALKKGKLDLVQAMINKGINLAGISQGVIRENGKGHRAVFEEEGVLHIAIKYAPNAYEAVKLLLDSGVNPYQHSFKYVLREGYLNRDHEAFYIDPIELAIDSRKPEVVGLLSQ